MGDSSCSTWTRDKVRVMSVCPWVVDTDLVRQGMINMTQEERERKQNSWVHKFIQPREVAAAVKQLIMVGKTGDVVTVGPEQTVYMFPHVSAWVFLACKVCHTTLKQLGLVRDDEIVSTRKLFWTAILGLVALMMLLFFVLSKALL